ncbi:Pfs, NB-ARC and TPR domain protein [Aspergillus undulatus]|uniref:Pfs, NB-ARC and TPR domain protein n=1 Tax=Aspergillus undulatus TaxID=1810928 RepID=UPI003CCDE86A
MRPYSRDEFAIAIICALTLEAEAVEELFDKTYDRLGEHYRKLPGDDNAYINGRIGSHNVVVCYMPGMGKGSAASVASSLKISYKRIEVALVVGICGGAPYPSSGGEIFLGDVIISDSVVQYDFGRQYPDGFEKKTSVNDTLGRPNRAIRAILASLQARQSRRDLQEKLSRHLQTLQESQPDWHYPTSVDDFLFKASYQHKHYNQEATCSCLDSTAEEICKAAVHSPCTLLGCDLAQVHRRRQSTEHNSPGVHIGMVASADTVMKSGEHRDRLVQSEGVVGFEMEGAGVWDNISCIIIKGVCDYADSHKNKAWQSYAAATGAAAAKAFLEYWEPTTREEVNKFHIPLDLSTVPAIEEFIGREKELNSLWKYLQPASSQTRKVAILHGLGGIGKTQLAIQFARQHKNEFTAIFWLSGKDQSALVSSLSSCLSRIHGQPVDVKATNEEEAMQRANQVLQWLAKPGNTSWLMIFDNIDQYSSLEGHGDCRYDIYTFFPSADHGSIIITSRVQELTELGKPFPVQKLLHEDAIQLLLQSSGFSAKDIMRMGVEEDIADLARLLDGLSLAVVIAGAYMRQTGTTVKEYLKLYRTSWFELQSRSAPTRHYQQGNMVQTWMITYKEIQKRDPTAANLLLLLAFFDNQDIWFELIQSGLNTSDPPPWFKIAVSSKLDFKTKVKALVEFSLVETKQEEGSYTLHPVVQDWCHYITASNNLANQLLELALISVGFMVPSRSAKARMWKVCYLVSLKMELTFFGLFTV